MVQSNYCINLIEPISHPMKKWMLNSLLTLLLVSVLPALQKLKAQPNNPHGTTNPLPPNYWLWAKFAHCDINKGNAITTDAKGNVYVTGQYNCPYFTLGGVTIRYSCYPYGDVFVVKYDPNGNVIWANSAGGNAAANSTGIAVDSLGNVFVTGYFTGTIMNFDRNGIKYLHNNGASNLFVVKYDPNGSPVWVNGGLAVPGTNAKGLSVACGKNNQVYLTGSFQTKKFSWGSLDLYNDSTGYEETFVARIDHQGYGYPFWAKTFNGIKDERAVSVSVDGDGYAYVGGHFSSASMHIDTYTVSNSGSGTSLFLSRIDTSGNVQWVRTAGNAMGHTKIKSVSADPYRNVFIGGDFTDTQVVMGNDTLTNLDLGGTTADVFYARYDQAGNQIWAKSVGSDNSDECTGISAYGDFYVVGNFYGHAVNSGSNTLSNANFGSTDMFFIRCNLAGNVIQSRSDGTQTWDAVKGVSFDSRGNAHATGWYTNQELILDRDTLFNGKSGSNMFVGKIGQKLAAPTPTASTVSIEDHKLDYQIGLYPNPSNGKIRIDAPVKGDIEVFNSLGQVVLRLKQSAEDDYLDVSSLSPGLYLLRLNTGQKRYSACFIRE